MGERVDCDVEYDDIEDGEKTLPGVRLTCTLCDHETESFGDSGRSIRRCLALMRDECPNNEDNFYVAEGSDDG